MSKKSVFYRNVHREKMVEAKRQKRETIKARWLDKSLGEDENYAAFAQLQKMPKNSCRARVRIRCALTGRPRGVFRRFGVSRTKLREMAMNGEIPGIIKSSW